MTERKARRRINSFNFQSEGAHVALVDKAANEQEVLVMKSAEASEDEIKKALNKDVTLNLSIMDFLCRYLNLHIDEAEIVAGLLGYNATDLYSEEYEVPDFITMIQDQMDSVTLNKSEAVDNFSTKYEEFAKKYDIQTPTENLEDTQPMTTANTDANAPAEPTTSGQSQEEINKAAEQREAEIAELRKARDEQAEELRILKAAEDRRQNEVYMAKAASHMPNIPESEGVQQADLSVALRKMEADPEMAALATLVSSYADVIAKSEKLQEEGTTSTDEQNGFDNQVARLAKSLKDADPNLTERQAEMRAFEQAMANNS